MTSVLLPTAYLTSLLALQASAFVAIVVILPIISGEWELSPLELGALGAGGFCGSALAAIPAGLLVDHISALRVLLLGFGGICASLLLAAQQTSVWPLVGCMILLGMCRIAIPPLTDRLAAERYPSSMRATIFGVKQTGASIGESTAAIVLPLLVVVAGDWRVALRVLALFLMASLFLACWGLRCVVPRRSKARARSEPTDEISVPIRSSVLRVVASTAFVMGMQEGALTAFIALWLVADASLAPSEAAWGIAALSVGGVVGRVLSGLMSDRAFPSLRLRVLSVLCGFGTMGLGAAIMAVERGAPRLAILCLAVAGLGGKGWVGLVRVIGIEASIGGGAGFRAAVTLTSGMLGATVGPLVFSSGVRELGYTYSWSLLALVLLLVAIAAWFQAPQVSGDATGAVARSLATANHNQASGG